MIVCYKLGNRFGNELSPKENIKIHLLHARDHNGKVLFSTYKGPSPVNRDKITGIILTTADGSYAIKADVVEIGKFDNFDPPEEYESPSLWDNQKRENLSWFAMDDVKEIMGGIKKGMYTTINGKDLLESISGKSYMVYI